MGCRRDRLVQGSGHGVDSVGVRAARLALPSGSAGRVRTRRRIRLERTEGATPVAPRLPPPLSATPSIIPAVPPAIVRVHRRGCRPPSAPDLIKFRKKISLALSAAHISRLRAFCLPVCFVPPTVPAAAVGVRPFPALMSAVPALSLLVFNIQGLANEVGILL
ncbi:hypothetical protein B0H10DRAFT_1942694 [Mycena sp. CBHHK59/15]|nr:hypothetical protein B0H10DRAFT_1942694 [Mycena sp. CBHHK59/15]